MVLIQNQGRICIRQRLAFWGAYFSLGPILLASEGCGDCFLFGGVLVRPGLSQGGVSEMTAYVEDLTAGRLMISIFRPL